MKFKDQVKNLLAAEDYPRLAELADGHGGKVGVILISLTAELDEMIRWRAIQGLGVVTARLYSRDPEQARRILRQLIWNLNEESGGIGWGMPEAFGEVLARQPELAREYAPLLAGYLIEEKTGLDHAVLQAGLVWALGRVKKFPPEIRDQIIRKLIGLLESPDLHLKGMAVWCLGELQARESLSALKDLPADDRMVSFMDNGNWMIRSISDISLQAQNRIKGK